MRIGVLIHMRPDTDLMAEFGKARSLGLDCCQLCCWNPALYTPEKAEAVKAAAAEHSIEITALWAGWTGPAEWNFTYGPATLGLVPSAYRGMRLAELMQASDFALWLGVTDIITHAGFLPENPDHPDFTGTVGALRALCKKLKERGQWFLFETGQETPVTMLRTIEAIGYDNVGINFDTANLLLYGKANTADALDVFGKYVRNTHCKDGFYPTCGSKLGQECALGEGLANMPLVVKKLNDIGYSGPYIIEREISGEKQTADIKAAKALLEKIFAEENLR
jgi:sugar phosphate isomerase/epimerase